jgi:hypothetical protein
MKWVAVLACPLLGCGYASQYVPIPDGRARVVWRDTDVAMDVSRPDATPECWTAARTPGLVLRPPDGGYWVPRYYGPALVVVHHGVPPVLPRPVLFSPSLELVRAIAGPPRWGSWAGAGVQVAPPSGVRGGDLRLSSGGGSDGGKLLVILAVIALIVLPPLDLTLALYRPESEANAAEVTDRVSLYNDLSRASGTACSYPVAP